MLMANKEKTEKNNFFTASKVSLTFIEFKDKKRKIQGKPGPNWSIWQIYLRKETIKPLKS